MKLASLYTPSAHIMPNNGLYEYYQEFFLEGLREPEEREPLRETIKSDIYQYEINDEEREFYEKLYVPQGNILEAKGQVMLKRLFGGAVNRIVFGEHVKDLLDFVVKVPRNMGLLVAPIGWGKTVLIRYTWLYLINKSEELQTKVIPIYISIDHNRNLFLSNKEPDQIRETLVKEILYERLVDVAKPFTQLDNDQFWNYLKKGSDRFNRLEQFEEDINKIYHNDITALESNVYKARMEARKADDFYPIVLRYIRAKLGKVPFLILDNVDTLSLEVNQLILDEAIFLSHEYNLKILISMRTPTYDKIDEIHNNILRAYPPALINMEKPDVKGYLKHRTKSLRQKIQEAKPQFEYLNYKGDIRITFKEGTKVFDAMLDMLLSEESLNILSFIAFYNLRKINALVLKYLATGYIDEHMLVKKLVGEEVIDEKYSKSPLWILLSSVITNNYKTRFSKVGMAYQEGVLNLYCNGRRHLKEYLIRIHILNYVKRHRDTNMNEIINAFMNIHNPTPYDFTESIKYAIWRLLSFDLLESPDYYKVESLEDMDRVKTIFITETGNYYRQEFRNYYEYLVYMKDDVELIENSYGIQDCIKIIGLPGRFKEVYKFLRMIYEAEKDFLFGLNHNQRIIFAKNFSSPEDSCPFIVVDPISSLINFGKARLDKLDSDADVMQEYETLFREVSQSVEEFKKTITE